MNIREFRKKNNLTQKELAKILDIPQSSLNYIELGKIKNSKHNKKIEEYILKHNQYYIVTKKYTDNEKHLNVYTYTKSVSMCSEDNKTEKKESWFSKFLKFIGVN